MNQKFSWNFLVRSCFPPDIRLIQPNALSVYVLLTYNGRFISDSLGNIAYSLQGIPYTLISYRTMFFFFPLNVRYPSYDCSKSSDIIIIILHCLAPTVAYGCPTMGMNRTDASISRGVPDIGSVGRSRGHA